MYLVELFVPGSRLEFEGEGKIQIGHLLRYLENVVFDAAISLSLFEKAFVESGLNLRDKHEQMEELRGTAIEEIMAEVGSFSYKIPGHEIDRRYRIKQAEAGIIPNLYEKRLPFIQGASGITAKFDKSEKNIITKIGQYPPQRNDIL